MPITKVGEINVEYYVEGNGPPLLMIMGFAGQAASWGEPFLSEMRKRFTVIRFSNRGTGQSGAAAAITVPLMAEDAAGLMRELGIEKAHVFGISMGGMIAQELVLNHPAQVQGLVLGCTNCGPAHSVQVPAELMSKFGAMMNLPVEERIRQFWQMTVTTEFVERAQEFLDGIMAMALATPTPWQTFGLQFAAIQAFDSYERLPQVQAPTLIIHGNRDALVPVENADVLQQRIGGARVRIIEGAGHCFFWEKPEESAQAIVEFLAQVPAYRTGRPAPA